MIVGHRTKLKQEFLSLIEVLGLAELLNFNVIVLFLTRLLITVRGVFGGISTNVSPLLMSVVLF